MHAGIFEPEVFPILCVFIVGVVAIIIFGVGGTLVKLVRSVLDYRLKSQMLDRGMTPHDIEQVLRAQSPEDGGEPFSGKGAAGKKNAFWATRS